MGKKENGEASQAFIYSFRNTYLWRYFRTTNDAKTDLGLSHPPEDIRDIRERLASLYAKLFNGTKVTRDKCKSTI